MAAWIQLVVVTLLIAWSMDALFRYVVDSLTVPTVVDLVHAPAKQYEDMYRVLYESELATSPSAQVTANASDANANANAQTTTTSTLDEADPQMVLAMQAHLAALL